MIHELRWRNEAEINSSMDIRTRTLMALSPRLKKSGKEKVPEDLKILERTRKLEEAVIRLGGRKL